MNRHNAIYVMYNMQDFKKRTLILFAKKEVKTDKNWECHIFTYSARLPVDLFLLLLQSEEGDSGAGGVLDLFQSLLVYLDFKNRQQSTGPPTLMSFVLFGGIFCSLFFTRACINTR